MTKSQEKSTEIVRNADAAAFPALCDGAPRIGDLIRENLGGSLSPADLMRLRVPSGGGTTWEIEDPIDGPISTQKIVGVIVWHSPSRSYFPTEYTGGNEPPVCSSRDGMIGYTSDASKAPGGECAACPLSKWESGKNGGQACSQRHVLAVLCEGNLLPHIISLPPASVKPFRQYSVQLLSRGKPHSARVVALSLLKTKNKGGAPFSQVVVSPVAELSPDEAARAAEYGSMIDAALSNVRDYEAFGSDSNPEQ